MNSKNKKDLILYSFCILISLLLFANIFAPWLSYNGKTYTIYGFYSAVKASGGLSQFDDGTTNAYTTYVFLFMPALAGILSGIKTILLIFKGRIKILSYLIYGLYWIYTGGFLAFVGYMPTIFAVLSIVMTLADFLINKYLEDYKKFNRKNRELRIKEKKEKEERKQRLFFPGKYSKYYYRLMLKRMLYHKWEYLLLIAGGGLSVTFLFTILSVQNMMKTVHSEEMFLVGGGMQEIMKDAVLMAIVINLVIMGFSQAHFVKKKLTQEQIMNLLGARSLLLKSNWILEYGICLICSVVVGCVCGGLNSIGFRWFVDKYLQIGALQEFSIKICIQAVLGFAVISLFSLAVNYEVYVWEKYNETVQIKKEKIPKRKNIIRGLLFGGICIYIAGVCYRQRRFAESMNYIYLFIIGSVLVLVYLTALWVRRIQKKSGQKGGMVEAIPFTYHFQGSSRTLAILLALHFLILSVHTMQLSGALSVQPAEELYPYDFVCMAYPEDSSIFTELESKGIEIEKYPMIRVTTVEGDAYDLADAANNNFMHVLWPQGQHIGIPESVYIDLQQKRGIEVNKPELEGEEIFIVYQQDSSFKAHPLDWYLFRKNPYLRIGQPLRDFSFQDREKLYPPREVKGEAIQILTGMFGRGMQEDIVVFSDEYFNTLKPEGPTEYYLLQAGEEVYPFAEKKLQEFAEAHQVDSSWDEDIQPYYERRQMIKNTESERTLKLVVNSFELLMLTVCTVLIAALKFVSEDEERRERYQLFFKIGMREKECRRLLRREIQPFFIIPLLLSALFSMCFTAVMFSLRMYTSQQVAEYLKYAIIIWLVYFIAQFVFYQLIKRRLYNSTQIEETGGERK